MEDAVQCRICLDGDGELAQKEAFAIDALCLGGQKEPGEEWVSPCACRGTQKWVHLGCLRAWQSVCMKNRNLHKAAVCSVCHAPYSYAPIQETLGFRLKRWIGRCTKPTCLLWPALFTLPLLFLFQIAVASVVLGMVSSFAKAVLRPVRVGRAAEVHPARGADEALTRRTLDRHAIHRARLGPGVVLVASPKMRNGTFAGATVLLEKYDPELGAQGIVLNHRLAPYERQVMTRRGRIAVGSNVWAGRGGPVASGTITVLHDLEGIPGSTSLGGGLFIGHFASTRYLGLEHAAHRRIKVFFGCSTWTPNQLEREIAAGVWSIREGSEAERLGLARLALGLH